MKLNYQEMELTELRTYVLNHYEDEEAFHVYVDRRKALNPSRISYSFPQTPEGLAEMQQVIREKLGK